MGSTRSAAQRPGSLDAGTAAAVDRSYATNLTRIIEETVLPWIDKRVGTL
ncbi:MULTISPECIES: hypothetical protein [Haloferacaceae]|uniref:Uncharacterized protein n=1 Tax=Halorubrum glutamatedens TaxID=2707018 RepID=A0ABD5QRC2_9EURY|nr:hypothetical protein [Halobellus captivus]